MNTLGRHGKVDFYANAIAGYMIMLIILNETYRIIRIYRILDLRLTKAWRNLALKIIRYRDASSCSHFYKEKFYRCSINELLILIN